MRRPLAPGACRRSGPSPRPRPRPAPAAAPEEQPAEAKPKPAAERRAPGKILWQYPKQIPGQAYSTAPSAAALSFGKNQFVVCIGRNVVGLEWKNQGLEKLWEYDADGHIPGSPVLGGDGLFRMHSGDGGCTASIRTAAASGSRSRSANRSAGPRRWSMATATPTSPVTAAASTKCRRRGEFKNTPYFRTRQKFDSTGLIHHGVLYIGCEDAFVYAIELSGSTGKNIWDQLENRGKTEWFINSAIALALDSTIVVAGRDEHLYGFNQDGKQAWKVHIPGQMLASPVVGADGESGRDQPGPRHPGRPGQTGLRRRRDRIGSAGSTRPRGPSNRRR